MPNEGPEDLQARFNYHKPSSDAIVSSHGVIRDAAYGVAIVVSSLVPAGRERATALTKLEEAMMWGNAGIARNQAQATKLAVDNLPTLGNPDDYQPASIELGIALAQLARDQAEWSQATFGTDQEFGPLGALRHLEKEAREAQESPSDITEYADCLMLTLDASRRAGIGPIGLVKAALAKLVINKTRTWPKTNGDEPTEHVRSEGV